MVWEGDRGDPVPYPILLVEAPPWPKKRFSKMNGVVAEVLDVRFRHSHTTEKGRKSPTDRARTNSLPDIPNRLLSPGIPKTHPKFVRL